jgi:hypothetical protein
MSWKFSLSLGSVATSVRSSLWGNVPCFVLFRENYLNHHNEECYPKYQSQSYYTRPKTSKIRLRRLTVSTLIMHSVNGKVVPVYTT